VPASCPGRSLSRFWKEEHPQPAGPILFEVRGAPNLPSWYPTAQGNLVAVQDGGLKLIRNTNGVEEVYDLARDPDEQRNLIDDPTLSDRIAVLRAVAERVREARAVAATSRDASGGTPLAAQPGSVAAARAAGSADPFRSAPGARIP
jgi:hypothetical protein